MKIKKILAGIFVVAFSMLFFACNKVVPSVEWNKDSLTMSVGEEVSLQEFLKIENANINDVVFSSLNENIVVVKNNKAVAKSEGNAFLRAKIDDCVDYITVVVEKQMEKFSAVTNLSFDSLTGKLSWNSAVKIDGQQTVYADSYKISINKDDQQQNIETTENYLSLSQPGSYEIVVVSQKEGFLNSDECCISFEILQSPTNLVFDKSTSTLSWDSEYTNFSVTVDDLTFDTDQKYITLDLQQVKTYNLQVSAKKGDVVSKPSEIVSITRLSVPQINEIEDGVLSFERTQQDLVQGYKIRIRSSLDQQPTEIDNLTGVYSLENKPYGDYYIEVKAVGNQFAFDSDYSESVLVTKLKTPTLTFDKSTKKITSDLENTVLYIKNLTTNQIKTINMDGLNYTFAESVGIYQIYAQTTGTSNQIKSDLSDSIYIKKLGAVQNVRHQTESNISTILFDGATSDYSYDIYIDDVVVNGQFDDEDNGKFVLTQSTDIVFANGTKTIKVVSHDYNFDSKPNYYVLNEDATSAEITIQRFEQLNPTYSNFVEWENIQNATCYQYELYKNGNLIAQDMLSENKFVTTNLDFGNYTFKVKAIGNSTKYLSSLQYKSVDFCIKQQLQSPTVIFDKQTLSLVVTAVDNADKYTIQYEQAQIGCLDNQNLVLDISAYLTSAKNYQFLIRAENSTDDVESGGNLYKSENTVINIEKLEQLQSFCLTRQQQFEIDLSNYQSKISSVQTVLNQNVTENLNSETFLQHNILKIKLIGNSSTSPYYLDSDYAEFVLEKLATPTNVKFSDYVISWDEVQNAKSYVVTISKGQQSFDFEITTNTIDISENPVYKQAVDLMGDGWSIVVLAKADDQQVTTFSNGYLKSDASESLTISQLLTPTLENFVSLDDDDLSIKIDFSDVENALSYEIDIDGDKKIVTASEILIDNLEQVKNYTITIAAKNPNYLTSKNLVVTLQRLQCVNTVFVNQATKTLDFDKNQNSGGTKINGIISEIPYSLADVDTVAKNIQIQLAGKSDIQNKILYLASAKTTFTLVKHQKNSGLAFDGSLLSWDAIDNCTYYNIVFENSQSGQLSIDIQAKDGQSFVTSFDLTSDAKVQQFMSESGLYTAKIRACMTDYQLQSDQGIGYISSDFSDAIQLQKLEQVQNVKVLANSDISQNVVTVSWDAVVGAQSYFVYVNDILLGQTEQTQMQTDKLLYTSEFSANGEFDIYIVANAVGKIASNKSDIYQLNRLPKIKKQSLIVSKNGVFSWATSQNATSFASYIEYNNTKTDVKIQNLQQNDYSEKIYETDYSGYIKFYVCAVGDGTRYLSSEYEFVQILKLDEPKVNILGNSINIEPSIQDPNATFIVKISFKDAQQNTTQLTTVTLNSNTASQNNSYVFPKDWDIYDDGEFVFEIYATSENCINSNTIQKTATRADGGIFKGFIRQSSLDDKINLVVQLDQTADGAVYHLVLKSGDQVEITQVLPNQDNLLVYPLQETFGNMILPQNFTFEFYVSVAGKLDSVTSKISGTRLNPISNFAPKNGKISWDTSIDSECSGYLLRVASGLDVVLKNIDKDVLSDDLQGFSEQLVLNIKAVGNITDQYKTEDVVLDSSYISGLDSIEQNLTVYKNAIPTDISVYLGMFKLQSNSNIYFWQARINQNEYLLSGQTDLDGYFLGTSQDIYSGSTKLVENVLYDVCFQAGGNDAQNVLNSDYSNPISIKVLQNSNQNLNDIVFEWTDQYVGSYFVSWKQSTVKDRYKVEINYLTQTLKYNVDGNQFVVDCDQSSAGIYGVSIGVLGSDNLEQGGFYYLSSSMTLTKTFEKLQKPNVSIQDGKLYWSAVENADKYFVYFLEKTSDDEISYDYFVKNCTMYSQPIFTNEWAVPDSFGSLTSQSSYYFGVRAVSSDYSKYAPSKTGVMFTEDQSILKSVTKLKAPDSFEQEDGVLLWNGSYNIDLFAMSLKDAISPFVYDGDHDFDDYQVVLKFVDSDNIERKYTVSPIKLFKTDQDYLLEYAGYKDYVFGWPTTSFITDDIGNITSGEHNITVMQKGDNKTWLDSNFNSGKNIYIPHAPKIMLRNFVLSWDAVNLPSSKSLNNANKYSVVTEDSQGKLSIVYQTNDLSIDLRDLVDSDKIVSGEYKIFVFVNGDNDYYINGLISNKLSIKVLPEAVAGMEGGILVWDSVSQTEKYYISADCGISDYFYGFETQQNTWDMNQLLCYDSQNNRLSYNIQVRCIGDGTNTISGKVADIGNVIKLLTPQLEVLQGAFEWEQIVGNEGYKITITGDDTQIINIGKDINVYETKTSGYNLYNIRAVGTTSSTLDKTSTSYAVSSFMDQGVYGIMLDQVSSLSIKNGRLMWLAQKDFNNNDVLGFKLSFGDINFYNPIFIEDYQTEFIDGNKYIVFEIDSSFVAGEYQVYVQAYSYSNYVYNQNTYSQLLGPINQQTTIDFAKLRKVSSLSAQNGVASWDANDNQSNRYLLEFTKDSEKYQFECQGNIWDPTKLSDKDLEIYKKLLAGTSYKLRIKVLGNDTNLINSDFCDQEVFNKIDTICEVEYLEEQDESFVIRWYYENQVVGLTDFNYALKYDNGDGEQILYSETSNLIRCGYDLEKKMYYGEINGSQLLTSQSTSLKYQVSVVPVSKTNILASDYSDARTVYPPKGISGDFAYNSENRSISWVYTSFGSDVKFRIVDELVTLDNDNNITIKSSNIILSQSTEYVLETIGLHRISICVVLTGESVASPYVYFDYPVAVDGLIKDTSFTTNLGTFTIINFDLFESGDGSETTPYLVTNQTQFENINQRLKRPSYLGTSQWNFVLNQDLELQNVTPINNFAGIFDGKNFTITYNISNTSESEIGLFKSLLSGGKIQNLCIKASVHQQNVAVSQLFVSAFVIKNYGTIQNCKLLEFAYTSDLTNAITFCFGGFAVNNYATIQNCVSMANITMKGTAQQQGVSLSTINIGGIVYANGQSGFGAKIVDCGNDGNITVSAQTIAVGGIATTHEYGEISGCYFKGNIDVAVTSQSASSKNYVGGLVATSKQKIKNSYTNCNITVNMNNLTRTVYVGGLVGSTSGTNGAILNNCFVANSNIVVQNDNLLKCTVGILVGLSEAQATQSQTCCYYIASSTYSPITNPPSGFNCESFTSYEQLLTNLNENDYAFKSDGNNPPKLLWEE